MYQLTPVRESSSVGLLPFQAHSYLTSSWLPPHFRPFVINPVFQGYGPYPDLLLKSTSFRQIKCSLLHFPLSSYFRQHCKERTEKFCARFFLVFFISGLAFHHERRQGSYSDTNSCVLPMLIMLTTAPHFLFSSFTTGHHVVFAKG